MSENNESAVRRIARHLVLAVSSCTTILGFVRFLPSTDLLYQISMATAYGSLFLIALSLLIGPWNVLRRQPNPLSSYLRRDIAIWAGILAIAHVIAGLQVHMGGKFWLYFIAPSETRTFLLIQLNPFGLTNYVGLFATIIFIMLLCLSNNASLRALGGKRWKYWQRWNYVAAVLVFLHGWIYQFVERRSLGFVILFTFVVFAVLMVQAAGFRRMSRT